MPYPRRTFKYLPNDKIMKKIKCFLFVCCTLLLRCYGNNPICNAQKGTFKDSRDQHVYKYVKIGTQTWMAENLAYLPAVSPSSDGSETSPLYYVYDYEGSSISEAKSKGNYTSYGVLYNWEAAKIACPSGWHLPTDEEWKTLEKNQGMSDTQADAQWYRDSGKVGCKLKEAGTSHWISSDTDVTNSSGFKALPGGVRFSGGFYSLGFHTDFWSASESGTSDAWTRNLYFTNDGVYRDNSNRYCGFSVRCLQN